MVQGEEGEGSCVAHCDRSHSIGPFDTVATRGEMDFLSNKILLFQGLKTI